MFLWVVVALVYGLFLVWYYNWSGPIRESQIDDFMKTFVDSKGSSNTDPDVIREFLRRDDGKEFVMQNFIKLQIGQLQDPVTGEQSSARKLLSKYTGPFTKALFRRGGHPVFMAQKVGGYIDSWEAYPDQQWDVTSMMRYKCRRDLIELASSSKFDEIHVFKISAIEKTISYPVQLRVSFFMRPGFYVPVFLVFMAILVDYLL